MKKITQLRKEKGLSQAKLAQLADINPTSLCRIEAGKEKPFGRAQKLANALNWKYDANLLFEEVENVADDETLTEAYFWIKDKKELTEIEECVELILGEMRDVANGDFDNVVADHQWRMSVLCEGAKTIKELLK